MWMCTMFFIVTLHYMTSIKGCKILRFLSFDITNGYHFVVLSPPSWLHDIS